MSIWRSGEICAARPGARARVHARAGAHACQVGDSHLAERRHCDGARIREPRVGRAERQPVEAGAARGAAPLVRPVVGRAGAAGVRDERAGGAPHAARRRRLRGRQPDSRSRRRRGLRHGVRASHPTEL